MCRLIILSGLDTALPRFVADLDFPRAAPWSTTLPFRAGRRELRAPLTAYLEVGGAHWTKQKRLVRDMGCIRRGDEGYSKEERRKRIVLCCECHQALHAGTLARRSQDADMQPRRAG